MKKRLILFFTLILFSSLVFADNVTLIEPLGEVYDTNNVSFVCNASALTDLSSIELFFGDDVEFKLNKTISTSGINVQETFNITGIPNGDYIWNCRAILVNTSIISGENNGTFRIDVANINNVMPELIQNLTEIQIEKNSNFTLNMSEYVYDEDILIYSVSEVTNINVIIDNELILFIPLQGWSGEKVLDIMANDGSEELIIPNITIKVVDNNAINWSNLEEFKITSIVPMETPYEMKTKEVVTFSVTTNDDKASYQWMLDGKELPGGNTPNYDFGIDSVGSGELSVLVTYSDGRTETQSWVVNIVEEKVVNVPIVEPEPEPECGNNVREKGETCSTCPEDVACGPGFECQQDVCVKSQENFIGVLIGLVIGMIVLIVGAIFVFRFIKRSTEPEEEKIKPLIDKNEQSSIPEKPNNITIIEKKPENVKIEKQEVIDIKPDPLLLEFISKMRAKGKSDEEIKLKLKASGWSDEQIAPGFK